MYLYIYSISIFCMPLSIYISVLFLSARLISILISLLYHYTIFISVFYLRLHSVLYSYSIFIMYSIFIFIFYYLLYFHFVFSLSRILYTVRDTFLYFQFCILLSVLLPYSVICFQNFVKCCELVRFSIPSIACDVPIFICNRLYS